MEDRLINEKQAADMLSIPLQTLRSDRCFHRGLPYVKLRKGHSERGSIRYRLSDIKKYVEQHLISSGE